MRLALSLLALLAVSSAAAATDCRREYARLPGEAAAPERLPLVGSAADAAAGFSLAEKSWRDSFRADVFRRRVIRITQDPAAAHDYLDFLKKTSAESSRLAAAHAALSSARAAPAELRRFQIALDQLIALTVRRASGRETREAAQRLEHALAGFGKAAANEEPFVAAGPEEIRRRIRGKLTRLNALLDPDDPPTPEKLGEIVEEVDELVALSHTRQALHPSPEGGEAHRYLTRVREDLRDVHDRFVAQAHDGDIDYKQQRFFLNPALRAKLEGLSGALRRTLGLSPAAAPRK